MNIKLPSSELNRMMKTITQCLDSRDQNLGNIEVIYDNNLFTIRSSNGQFSAVMSTPILGGDGEVFCVDGTLFARVCSMCSGDISISTDGKVCTIKGAGKTRLPIVSANIPSFEHVNGTSCTVSAEQFATAFGGVAHAISSDQGRIVLTGVKTDVNGDGMRMVTLDGFRLAVETAVSDGEPMSIVIPGGFMKLIASSTSAGETITITAGDKRIQAATDGMLIASSLLAGKFPDVDTLVPKEFKTKVLIDTELLRNALKGSSVINSTSKLVKFVVENDKLTVMNNSEQAAYEAELKCDTQGDPITIAFNQKYIMDTINSLNIDSIVLMMNTPTSPAVIKGKDIEGYRLILPVRVAG